MNRQTKKFGLNSIVKFFKSRGVLIAFLLLFVFASVKYDAFLNFTNITNILRQVSINGMIAIGMTFVILTGGIDLSVGSILAVSGVLAANLTSTNTALAIIVPLVVAGCIGLVNGLIVTKLKIVPFVGTLAMMLGARGIAYIATGEKSIRVGKLSEGFTQLARGFVFNIPIPAIIFITSILIATLVLKYLGYGRHVLAVGGNEEAARMMGLKVDKVKMIAYTISGVCAGLAGVILTSRLGAGQPVAGEGYELTAIASVVLGGTLLTGGAGKFSGTLTGVLILGMITNIFNMQGNINTWWQNVLMGVLLLTVVVVQAQVSLLKKA